MSRQFYASVVELSEDAIFIKTLSGKIVDWNKSAEQMYGYTAKQILGKHVNTLIPADRQNEFDVIMSHIRKGRPVEHFETIRRRRDGQYINVSVSVSPIKDDAGIVIAACSIARNITDRIRMENELQRSYDQLAVILRGVAEGITLQRPDGSLLYANDKAAELIGYPSVEALLTDSVANIMQKFDLKDADGNPVALTDMPGRKALLGEESEKMLSFRVLATGEERWSLYKSLPVLDRKGEVEYALNIFQDITEQKRNENVLRFLSDASNILASSLDYQTTLVSVARLVVPRFADWCSVDLVDETGAIHNVAVEHVDRKKVQWAKELNKKNASDPNAEQGVARVMRTGKSELYPLITDDLLRQSIKDEKQLRIVKEIGMKSVMIVPLLIRGKTLGAIVFVSAESDRSYTQSDLALAEDLAQRAALAVENSRLYLEAQEEITERKRAESEVRTLNNELEKRVIERTSELKAANRDLKNEIAVRTEAEVKDKANLQRLKGAIDNLPMAAIATDEQQKILHVNQRFCRMFNLDMSADTLIGKSGQEVISMLQKQLREPERYVALLKIAILQNVEQLGQEIVLVDGRILSSDFLSIMVDDVNRGLLFLFRDITHEKRIDAAKSEFMSLASHQLRTPLTTVRWALGRLNKTEKNLDDAQRSMLTAAKNATQLMAETINAMLTISRIEAGQIKVKHESIDVREMIESIQRESEAEFSWKEQLFSIEVLQKHDVHSDRLLLKEVLSNLLRNAFKYTEERGRVDVRITDDNGRMRIDVQDTGVGIPLHQQERVFQKFFRADNAISKEPDGTGLGLYLVFITVALLGGTITFSSEEGKGTTFSVFLSYDIPHSL